MLLEQLEGALPRLVALAGQELQRLLAGQHLLAAHNAAVLVLDQVLLVQATGRVLRRAVEHLSLGANRGDIGHLIFGVVILSAGVAVSKVESGRSPHRAGARTMLRPRIVLRVTAEHQSRLSPRLHPAIIHYRLAFPQEILPPYQLYLPEVGAVSAKPLPLTAQLRYTNILLHTRLVGEYTEAEETAAMRTIVSYIRDYDDATGAGTKVEPGLPLA